MPPTPKEIALVRKNFEDLRPYQEPTSINFYEELFERAPELRSLFREDLKAQGMRFMNTLGLILANMDHPDEPAVDFAELGKLHATLGIRKAHFEPMEEALMASLRNKMGALFTAEVESAWRSAYSELTARLVEEGDIPD